MLVEVRGSEFGVPTSPRFRRTGQGSDFANNADGPAARGRDMFGTSSMPALTPTFHKIRLQESAEADF